MDQNKTHREEEKAETDGIFWSFYGRLVGGRLLTEGINGRRGED